MVGIGGEVRISSGMSSDGSSGRTALETSHSGEHGVSGDVYISSGGSEAGRSGGISLHTGLSKSASGGSLSLKVGDASGLSDGGDILLFAGLTSAQHKRGGTVKIVGGEGSSNHADDGGDGGDILLLGGEAKGEDFYDDGGMVSIEGGTSLVGYGGSLEFISGQSTEESSGDIRKFSARASHLLRSLLSAGRLYLLSPLSIVLCIASDYKRFCR